MNSLNGLQIKRFIPLIGLLFVAAGSPVLGAGLPDVIVGDFASRGLAGWSGKSFNGKTNYRIVKTDIGRVVKAVSRSSASGMFREIKIDLEKTPCLTWSWKVENILAGLNEKTKSGDDYAVRVYVVFSGGLFPWNTRTLSYVWSSGQPPGSAWPNAYSANAINVAVNSGKGKVGAWVHQSRNVVADFRRFIGGDIKQADGIAIMTDTDDSGREATSYYGDIHFTASCD